MNRFRTLVLGLGLSLSLVLGASAAPPDATTKKAKPTPSADTKMGTTKTDKKAAATTAQTPPGPGYVWVNKESKVFHREGSRYFGNTKSGEFLKESDAVAQGYREAGKTGATKGADTTTKKAGAATAGKKM